MIHCTIVKFAIGAQFEVERCRCVNTIYFMEARVCPIKHSIRAVIAGLKLDTKLRRDGKTPNSGYQLPSFQYFASFGVASSEKGNSCSISTGSRRFLGTTHHYGCA